MENDLVEFCGAECPHCKRMEPLVKRLEKKTGEIEKLEVWHNEKNAKMMNSIEQFRECCGVPFFFNRKTKKIICGEVSYEELEKWAE